MQIVYIIGAGASRAIHTSVPMMDMIPAFLQHFRPLVDPVRQALAEANISAEVRDEDKASEGRAWLDLKFKENSQPIGGGLEGLLQTLEDQAANTNNKVALAAEKAHDLINGLINRLFLKLDSEVIPTVSENPYDSLAKGLAANNRGHIHTFVSFNYDFWLERSLQKLDGYWDPATGYLDNAVSMRLQCIGPSRKQYWLKRERRSTLLVCKPHGSLSWLKMEDKPNAPPIIILDRDKKLNQEPTGNVSMLSEDQGQVELDGFIYRPFIIPPVRHKGVAGEFMYQVYFAMDTAIRNADAIVIIGWSMPITDIYIRQRIFDSLSGKNLPILIVCDRNPTRLFYNRYKTVIAAKENRDYQDGFTSSFVEKMLVPLWNGQHIPNI